MASGCCPASTGNVVSCQRAPCRNQTRAPLLGQDSEEWVNIHRRSLKPLSTETVKGKTQTVYGQAQFFAGVTAGPRAFVAGPAGKRSCSVLPGRPLACPGMHHCAVAVWVRSPSFLWLARAPTCCPLSVDRNPEPCLVTCCF